MRKLILLIFICIAHLSYGQNVYYNVQFIALSSNTKIFTDVEKLGSIQIDYFSEQNVYRYRCGHFDSRTKAESLLRKIKVLGFSDAFIASNSMSSYDSNTSSKSTKLHENVGRVDANKLNAKETVESNTTSNELVNKKQDIDKVVANGSSIKKNNITDSVSKDSISNKQEKDKTAADGSITKKKELTKIDSNEEKIKKQDANNTVINESKTKKENINKVVANGTDNEKENNSTKNIQESEEVKQAASPVTAELEKTKELKEAKQEIVKEDLAWNGAISKYTIKSVLTFLDDAHVERDKFSKSKQCNPNNEDVISLNLMEDLSTILKSIEAEYDVEYEDPKCEGCYRIMTIKKK